MTATPLIRSASPADAETLLDIYRPYVESTPVSFELETPSVAAFAERIGASVRHWAWLVAELDGDIVGYAYGGSPRPRQAYRWSVETSAYVRPEHHRRGVARALYGRLLNELGARGYANAYAGVTVPNPASIGFHQRLGFETIGVFPSVGRKFDKWHDVAWLHRPLGKA